LALAIGFAFCLANVSWSQRSRSDRSEIDDLIYNEKIDDRSEDERKSDAEKLIDAVRSMKDEGQAEEGRGEEVRDRPRTPRFPTLLKHRQVTFRRLRRGRFRKREPRP
jgi:hypothetical protein